MKKRFGFLLAALAVLMMFCLAGTAGAEEYVDGKFRIYCAAEETIQPDYPDLSGMIGEGLTHDDFQITYECSAYVVTMDPATGQVSVSDRGTRHMRYEVFVTYTPKIDGVGKKTVFRGHLYTGVPYAYLRVQDGSAEITLGVGQSVRRRIDYNSYNVPRQPACKVDNPEIVTAKLEVAREYTSANDVIITAVAPGETTVTAYTYNGMTADIHVKVLAAPTELTFAQDVYECYAGEKLSLGVKLGDGEHMASFSEAKINHYQAYDYFEGGLTGYFCYDHWGDYTLRATTYNGFSDTALIRVYDRTAAVDVRLSADIARVGEDIKVESFDAEGNYVRARYISITKGAEIASLDADKLITTAPGEIEVTVTNLDGTTVSRTFTIEPYPTEILLNATDLTLEIGEAFDIEVGFDQGSLPYTISINESEGYDYLLPPVRIEGNRLIAQNSGTTKVRVGTDTLVALINVTVPVGDKTPMIVWPEEEPFPVNGTFQFAVKDMAGNTLPATFSLGVNDQSGTITEDGYFKAVKAGSVSVTATLEDGRKLTKSLKIVQKPNWMRVGAMIITVGESQSITVATDVGDLYTWDLEVSVKDESIVTWSYPTLRAKKVGKTEVTVTCVHNGASTTFTVEVRPENDDVFVAATSYELPYGFSMQLPAVLDAKGNEKYVKWVITHDTPGEGNPEKSGFKLEDDVITCTWPTARCEVTGYMDGASKWVRVTVFGYKMAETIRIEPEIIMLPLGEKQKVEVLTDEPGAVIPEVYWVADTEGIVSWSGYGNNAYWMFTGEKPGTTLVMAFLDNGAYALCMVTVVDPNYDPSVRLPGDANVDGSVNILDALRILQYCVGWNVEINLSNSDVDADGAVTIEDALRVLQYDAGWEVELL